MFKNKFYEAHLLSVKFQRAVFHTSNLMRGQSCVITTIVSPEMIFNIDPVLKYLSTKKHSSLMSTPLKINNISTVVHIIC